MGKFVAALILVLLLAGCSGKGSDSSGTDSGTAASSGVVSSHGTGGSGNNPPTGSVHASVASGMSPLTVVFTMEGADKDKDALSWTLDVNGDKKPEANGKTLPATANFTYNVPGVYNVTYKLSDGKADVSFPLVVTVTTNVAAGQTLFLDDAEGDASKWTITSEVVVAPNIAVDPQGSGQEHPLGPWRQVTDQFHLGAKSWHAHYPDNYVSTMTLAAPLTIPPGGATVSFWLKGSAEDNSYDGIYVNTGADAGALENQVYQAAEYKDWTQFSFTVPAGPLVLQFVFKADISCSSEPQPVGGGDGTVCGPGWDGGGYWVDDIQVS